MTPEELKVIVEKAIDDNVIGCQAWELDTALVGIHNRLDRIEQKINKAVFTLAEMIGKQGGQTHD